MLADIDASAGAQQGRWAEKRVSERRRYRARCSIRFLSADGASVRTVAGTTRDVSLQGLGFVSPEHFLRKASLVVSVADVTATSSTSSARRSTPVASRRAGT